MLLAFLGACTFPPIRTSVPSPLPTPSPSPTATPEATPAAVASPSGSPTGAMPQFLAGERILTAIDGLRVRQRPGVSSVVIAGLLPLGAALQVVMGPIPVDDVGWYLVTDADEAEPQFEEGWIASGFEPEPFLEPTADEPASAPFVASFAQTGNAEYGPIEIGDGAHAIRWIAVDPERTRCTFSVSMASGGGEPVPAIRATVGNGVDPGTLQPNAFDGLGVRGQVFVAVESDCAWAMVIARAAGPSPSQAAP